MQSPLPMVLPLLVSTSKHPERTVMLYELFRQDEEIYRLINYGIEGVSYVINEEGKLDRPEGFDSARDGFSINWWGGRRQV